MKTLTILGSTGSIGTQALEVAENLDFQVLALAAGKNVKKAEEQNTKQVYYLCMEFLMGRSLKNSLFNLGLTEPVKEALAGFGVKLDKIYEMEPDAGLGNGGLGRLAACYLDGLASGKYPAMGYSIRYEYGIFRQKLVDGWQTELPDFWLPGGEVWFVEHPDDAVEVRFDGTVRDWWDGTFHQVEHTNYSPVMAIPHDMMVAGADGEGVSLLRLWSAEAPGLDMKLFNEGDYMRAIEQESMAQVISKVLYPADNHPEGKSLRLRQQYFLVSASVQDIVRNHLKKHSMDELPDFAAIHTNDTHPVLAIPELMRILLDECGYPWDKAWDIVTRTVAYTNHTVMSEALECWPVELFKTRLPRIFQIVTEIDNRHRERVWEQTHDADYVERTAVIHDGVVKMANLAVAACHKVNGVSRLHSEILKNDVFRDFCGLNPDKFTNVTNGIAHARMLVQKGCRTYLPGGQVRPITEAITGPETLAALQHYNFTKAFMGANGVSPAEGFTTPDPEEASIKTAALQRARERWFLVDNTKFDMVYSAVIGDIGCGAILTNHCPDPRYAQLTFVKECSV